MIPIPLIMKQNLYATWSSAWGPVPTHWWDASSSDFLTDKVGGDNLTKDFGAGNIEYSSTQNNLTVAKWNGTAEYVAKHTTGSFQTTHFVVFKRGTTTGSGPLVRSSYDPDPGDLGPGGGGQYNRGQFYFQDLGTTINSVRLYQSWSYNGSYPSEQLPYSQATYSYTGSGWNVLWAKSDHSVDVATFPVSGELNGSTYNSRTSQSDGGGIAAEGDIGISTIIGLLNNEIAEVVFYDSSLTADEVSSVENYLKDKWGITY